MNDKYAKFLKEARRKAGINQSDLAHGLYINQSDVSKIENGKKEAPISLAVRWAQLTGSQDALAALVCGTDISVVIDMLEKINTLFINPFLL